MFADTDKRCFVDRENERGRERGLFSSPSGGHNTSAITRDDGDGMYGDDDLVSLHLSPPPNTAIPPSTAYNTNNRGKSILLHYY